MITLLHGADTFSSTARLRELRRELDPDGFNTVVLDAPDATVAALRAACGTTAFFGGARYVEARGLLTRWLGGKRTGKKATATDPAGELLAYLPALPSTTHLLFWEPAAVTLPTPLTDGLRHHGASITRFEAPLGAELREWVEARAIALGATIEPAAVVALLDASCPSGWREAPRGRDGRPPDLAKIDAELSKLATAVLGVRGGPRITKRVVAALVGGEQDTNVFALVNAVTESNGAAAIAALRTLLDQGSPPEALLALLTRQLLLLDRLRLERQAPGAGAARSPGQAHHLERQLRALGAARVGRGVELALEADLAVKTGRARNADEALYWLVLELCEVGPPGPALVETAPYT